MGLGVGSLLGHLCPRVCCNLRFDVRHPASLCALCRCLLWARLVCHQRVLWGTSWRAALVDLPVGDYRSTCAKRYDLVAHTGYRQSGAPSNRIESGGTSRLMGGGLGGGGFGPHGSGGFIARMR